MDSLRALQPGPVASVLARVAVRCQRKLDLLEGQSVAGTISYQVSEWGLKSYLTVIVGLSMSR